MKCKHCGAKLKAQKCENSSDKSENSGSNGSNSSKSGTNSGSNNGFFGIGTGDTKKDFLIGTLIGVAATYILTNENAQKAILKGFAKLSSLVEMGVEELKERYEDAKAEVNS